MPTYTRRATLDEVAAAWPRDEATEPLEEARALVALWEPYYLVKLTADEAGNVLYQCGDENFPVRSAPCLCKDSLRHQEQYLRDHGHLLARPIIRKRCDKLYVVDGAHRLRAAFDAGNGVHEVFCGGDAAAQATFGGCP
jgi:hypothetical protein